LRHRNIELFDFLADRCAAASAGSSSGSQNHSGNAGDF
jgi:hypothetical protein